MTHGRCHQSCFGQHCVTGARRRREFPFTPKSGSSFGSSDQIVATSATLRELLAKLLSPKFDRYLSRERRDALLLRLAPLTEIVEVVERIRALCDPKDDKFLEAAVNGHADVLVTGDRDLLDLHPFRGIPVLTPAGYVARKR